jgi:hypothetical protein
MSSATQVHARDCFLMRYRIQCARISLICESLQAKRGPYTFLSEARARAKPQLAVPRQLSSRFHPPPPPSSTPHVRRDNLLSRRESRSGHGDSILDLIYSYPAPSQYGDEVEFPAGSTPGAAAKCHRIAAENAVGRLESHSASR